MSVGGYVGACSAAGGGRPRRVRAGPDFEKNSQIRFQILGRGRFLFENRPMMHFQRGNDLCLGSGMGSGTGSGDFFQNPARPGAGRLPPRQPPSMHPHPPTLTHLHMSTRLTLIHPDCHLLGKKTSTFTLLSQNPSFATCFMKPALR